MTMFVIVLGLIAWFGFWVYVGYSIAARQIERNNR